MTKKKIGLLLAYKNPNYGTMLQAFATQYIVESFGFETEIIDYIPDKINKHYTIDWGIFRFLIDTFQEKKKKAERYKCKNLVYQDNACKRQESYKTFISNQLHGIKRVVGYSKLKQIGHTYDAVLIGSDQRWHPGFSFGVDSSLRFVPSNVRTISYATSLGVSDYPHNYWRTSRKAWNRIDFLSVRERTGADIIKKICGESTPVQVVVDPTYLITRKEWERLFPIEKKYNEKYLFCYFLGNDVASKLCAKRYAEKMGLKLVSVVSNESFSAIDQQYADYLVVGESPMGFVNWIRGAECVFTDSFHGTAFSIINEKQIYIFYRKNTSVKLSRHSRIDDIISLWDIPQRLIIDKERDWNMYIESPINYDIVTPKLLIERKKSLNFLNNALNF